MVYAPVSRNVEAASTTDEKLNAMLNGAATENLAVAAGARYLPPLHFSTSGLSGQARTDIV
jgi:hypothetical protein